MTSSPVMITRSLVLLVLSLFCGDGVTAHVCDGNCGFLCDQAGCLLPNSPYVFIGNNLTLSCILRYENRSSELYYTWKNDVNISSEYQRVISPDTLQLNMPVSESSNEVTVKCRASWNSSSWSQRIETEYPPANVTDIKIVVNGWKNMTLTWEVQNINPENLNVSVIWTAAGAKSWYYCDSHNHTYCFLGESYKDSTLYKFNISVTNTRKMKTHLQSLDVIPDHYALPAPVTITHVNKTSRCVILHWTHLKISKDLTFKVIAALNGTEVVHNTTEDYNFSYCDLRPFRTYDLSISAKPIEQGYWSAPVNVRVKTLEDKPDHGPIVTPGGFQTQDCVTNNKRSVFIFLKIPDAEYRNGNLTKYSLLYVPSDGGESIPTNPPLTSVYEDASLRCDIDYNVSMTVSTRMGESPESVLHVPRQGDVGHPENVLVSYKDTTTTTAQIHWESHSQPLSWTFFWCQGNIHFKKCQGEINWRTVNSSQTSHWIDNFDPLLIYGVSMRTQHGNSGITWNDCIYNVDSGPEGKPTIESVDTWPNLGLTVHWIPITCDTASQILITHYVIQYCVESNCVRGNTTSDQSQFVLRDLQEGMPYNISLKQVAVSGKEGQFSDPVIAVPENRELTTSQIVGVVFGCLIILVILLGGVVQCFRFACRKWKEKEIIEMPRTLQIQPRRENDHSPSFSQTQETIQMLASTHRHIRIFPEISEIVANGCIRQNSKDSGQGSLPTEYPESNLNLSPDSPVNIPEIESLKKEVRASKNINKEDQLPAGYAVVTLDGNSAGSNGSQCTEEKAETSTGHVEEEWGGSGFSNSGYESDSVDPYVTAFEKDEDATGSTTEDTSGSTYSKKENTNSGFTLDVETDDKDISLNSKHSNLITGTDSLQKDIMCDTVIAPSLSLSPGAEVIPLHESPSCPPSPQEEANPSIRAAETPEIDNKESVTLEPADDPTTFQEPDMKRIQGGSRNSDSLYTLQEDEGVRSLASSDSGKSEMQEQIESGVKNTLFLKDEKITHI